MSTPSPATGGPIHGPLPLLVSESGCALVIPTRSSAPAGEVRVTCPRCEAEYARGRDEARAEYQATYEENMPRIAAREHRRGFIEGQAAPAGTPPPAPLPVPPR